MHQASLSPFALVRVRPRFPRPYRPRARTARTYPTGRVVVGQLTRGLIPTRLYCEPVLSPAARRRQGTLPFATCARRGLRKETAMRHEDTIEIRGVTVMRQTDGALLCRMGSQHRWIASIQLQPGTTVAREGDVGIVVL